MKVYALTLACVVLASSCVCCEMFEMMQPLRAGTTAPAFTLTSTAGEAVSLSDFSGRVVLLNFWTAT